MTAIWVTLFFVAGIALGYLMQKGKLQDLEAENLALREGKKKANEERDAAMAAAARERTSRIDAVFAYKELVEKVKAKAAESKTKKKATSKK